MPDGFDHDSGPTNRQLGYSPRDVAVTHGREVSAWTGPIDEADDADDLSLNLREYWRVILKHKLLIGLIVAAALIVGAAITLLTPPVYTAGATLQIDRETARIVEGQDVQPQEQLAGEEFFQTQYGLLRSRSLSVRVMEALGLARSKRFLESMGEDSPDNAVAATRRKRVTDVLQQNLRVNPVRGSRLVTITFDSPNPALSAQIVNAYAENFIGANLDRRFESSSYARDFLEKRLQQVKQRLEETERQLVAYATQQQIINLRDGQEGEESGTQSLAAADLSALNSALATAKSNRIAAEERWRQAQVTQAFGATEVLASPTVQELSQSRARLAAQYEDQLRIYKPDFPAMLQLKAQIDETDRQLRAETQGIRSSVAQNTRANARANYNIALNEERALTARVEQLKASVLNLRGRSIQYNILQREVDTNRSLYDGLLQRYKEVGVAGGVTTNNISIVDRAEPPSEPSKPQPLLNMVMALVIGLGLGVLAAFLLEALDQAIRTPADVEEKLGLPLLGTIPKLDKGLTPAEALNDARSPLSEAYFSVRAALQFSTRDGTPKTLLVTSSRPGEGKSTTSLAIAQSFARLGLRTLIVDGDLRNPSLHKGLGAENSKGLSSLLTGSAQFHDVIQTTEQPNLLALTSGPLPLSPAELLAAGRLRGLLGEAQREFDLVLIDGPPVMGLADAPMISALTHGTLLVVEAGAVGRNQAKAAVKRLHVARATLIGVVMTKFSAKHASYGYGYAYEYAYGSRGSEVQTA